MIMSIKVQMPSIYALFMHVQFKHNIGTCFIGTIKLINMFSLNLILEMDSGALIFLIEKFSMLIELYYFFEPIC